MGPSGKGALEDKTVSREGQVCSLCKQMRGWQCWHLKGTGAWIGWFPDLPVLLL